MVDDCKKTGESMSVWCRLFGHEYSEYNSTESGVIVKCVKCDHETEWSKQAACGKFGHRFEEGVCIRCDSVMTRKDKKNCKHEISRVIGVVFLVETVKNVSYTQRQYKCMCCGGVFHDSRYLSDEELLEGNWVIDPDHPGDLIPK